MSMVIDSLVVQLSLDSKGVIKGAKQTDAAFKKMNARLQQGARQTEQAHNNLGESVRSVREQFMGLLTVVTAGRGLNTLFRDTSANVTATRNFAQSIDVSTEALSRWEAAARMTGGTAEGMRQAFGAISSSVAEWNLNKTFSAQLYQMQRAGIAVMNKDGNLLGTEEIAKRALRYLSTVKDVRTRVAQARAFGMESALPLVNAGPTAVARALRDAQKDGADVTKEQAAANANLHYSQERLSTSFQSLAREIESDFAPQMAVVNDAVRKVTTTLRNHQKIADAAFTGISATALALGVAMAGPFVAGFVAANAAVLTVVAAFGAVVTAGTYFYRDWSSWMDGGKSSFGKFYQSVANGWQGIKKQTSSAIHEMAPAWNKFESGAQEVWEAFASLFTEDSDTIRARWLVLTGDASANWTKAMSFMRGEWDSFLNAVKLGVPAVEVWLKGMFHRGWDGAKEAASASWGYIEKGAVSVARYAADRAEVAHNLLTPRGLRNNNPGNIRQWAGAGSDGQFATFGTPEAGLTAMAQNIEAYMHKHGLQSIRQIISRWAPPEDGNLTNEYIAQVAKDMGVNADARLNGSDTNTVASLMHAITRKENGYDPYANLNQSIAGRVIAMQSGAERPVQNHTTIHVTVQAHSKDPHGVARETARALIAATNRGAH